MTEENTPVSPPVQEEKARIGQGNVDIKLMNEHGVLEDLVLEPSFIAARTISNQERGFVGALERCGRLDIVFITEVIAIGLGYGYPGGKPPPPDLPERVWRTGITDDAGGLAERAVTYIRVLMAGGKPLSPDPDSGGSPTKTS